MLPKSIAIITIVAYGFFGISGWLSKNVDYVLHSVTNVECVAQLTGENSINKTDRWDVYGTDLGHMISMDGLVYMVFGDTFGFREDNMMGAGGLNWRSNTMAIISDINPSDGLLFDEMLTDDKGRAKELLSSKKHPGVEHTVIPTGGFSVGSTLYLHYMSVRNWGAHGVWHVNYSGLARSSDKGKTWTKLEEVRWSGDSNFVQVATWEINGEIYFWSIPAGRFGGVKLKRVSMGEVENINQYEYYAGLKDGMPLWSGKKELAEEIVRQPVGELSVIWNKYLDRWIMTYLNESTAQIEIREGIKPWGPWSSPLTLVTSSKYPGLYGAYMHPSYVEEGGRIIYFAMSQWDPYNVFWMRAELNRR